MPSKPQTKRSRGRPAFQVTVALQRQVSIAAGGGMRHIDIANALGISRETLEKHFQTELSSGAHRRRFDALQAMYRAATKGSVSAAKMYLATEPQGAVPPLPAPDPAPPVVKRPEGKKAEQAAASITAADGTEWADLLNRPSTLPPQ